MQVLLPTIANQARMEIEELKGAYRKGDNFAFESTYPIDRTIRSQLRNVKLMVN